MLDIQVRPFDDEGCGYINDDVFVVEVKAGPEYKPAAFAVEQSLIEAANYFFASRASGRMFCAPCGTFKDSPFELVELHEDGRVAFVWDGIPIDMDIEDDGVSLTMYCPKHCEGDDQIDGTHRWGNDLPPTFWIHPAFTIRRLLDIAPKESACAY